MRDRNKLKLIHTKYSRNKEKTQRIKPMTRVGFEHTISVFGRSNAKRALDGSTTVMIMMAN